MGREVRMVPPDWEHPEDSNGHYIPLHDGYNDRLEEMEKYIKEHSLREAVNYFGSCPDPDDYMLVDVPDEKRTHYMMYEDTTEGTPISPAFATPEELARWLSNNGASAFGGQTASYEAWLATIKRGFAFSAVVMVGESGERSIISGVEGLYGEEQHGH